jgi:phosphocarrier protein HPr
VEATGQMVSLNVTIQNRLGLHARPAMAFVDMANQFKSDIKVTKAGHSVDGKSIMQMMMLAATQGTVLQIEAKGADAAQAAEALKQLVDRKFDEE